MDVLYYIGNGSLHNNLELRLSLRALEKHCKDVDKVWIVGNKPHFLKDVEYLWVEDKDKWWKNANTKTLAAIDAGISDKFLLMNDDFFMLEDFTAGGYPYYHRGELPTEADGRNYTEVLVNTRRKLESLGATTYHYGVHCPMVIEADKYKSIKIDEPLSVRCMYGNLYCQGEKVKDVKTDNILATPTKCFSAKPWAKEPMAELLKRFDKPSRWEKEDV